MCGPDPVNQDAGLAGGPQTDGLCRSDRSRSTSLGNDQEKWKQDRSLPKSVSNVVATWLPFMQYCHLKSGAKRLRYVTI